MSTGSAGFVDRQIARANPLEQPLRVLAAVTELWSAVAAFYALLDASTSTGRVSTAEILGRASMLAAHGVGAVSALSDLHQASPALRLSSLEPLAKGLGLISGAISLGLEIRGIAAQDALGDYAQRDCLAISAAASSVGLGAAGLAVLGATPPGWITIPAVVIALGAGILAGAFASSELELDLSHCYFGEDYDRLVEEYDALPEATRVGVGPVEMAARFAANIRFCNVRNLAAQVQLLNRYFFIESVYLTRDRAAPHPTFTIHANGVVCTARSRIYFELYSSTSIGFATAGTFYIEPEALTSASWTFRPAGTVSYRAEKLTSGLVNLEVRFMQPADLPMFADIDGAVIVIGAAPSIEFGANEALPSAGAENPQWLERFFGAAWRWWREEAHRNPLCVTHFEPYIQANGFASRAILTRVRES